MFAGIVEATASLSRVDKDSSVTRVTVEKPSVFNDLNGGDSIAVNGVCLTVEALPAGAIVFSLGPETLQVTGWVPFVGQKVNLERSLRMGDRIHGHIVNGHVDEAGVIDFVQDGENTRDLGVRFSQAFAPYIWRKGSVAIHGVSLTVNRVEGLSLRVGLIPETLKRTNLGLLKKGDPVHLEADAMARAWHHWRKDGLSLDS